MWDVGRGTGDGGVFTCCLSNPNSGELGSIVLHLAWWRTDPSDGAYIDDGSAAEDTRAVGSLDDERLLSEHGLDGGFGVV